MLKALAVLKYSGRKKGATDDVAEEQIGARWIALLLYFRDDALAKTRSSPFRVANNRRALCFYLPLFFSRDNRIDIRGYARYALVDAARNRDYVISLVSLDRSV